jgi:hypothetical protein
MDGNDDRTVSFVTLNNKERFGGECSKVCRNGNKVVGHGLDLRETRVLQFLDINLISQTEITNYNRAKQFKIVMELAVTKYHNYR